MIRLDVVPESDRTDSNATAMPPITMGSTAVTMINSMSVNPSSPGPLHSLSNLARMARRALVIGCSKAFRRLTGEPTRLLGQAGPWVPASRPVDVATLLLFAKICSHERTASA